MRLGKLGVDRGPPDHHVDHGVSGLIMGLPADKFREWAR
jgi:hypothetical protein